MLRSYLKLAWKILWRRKFFTAISLFGIAITLVVLITAAALLDQAYAPMPPEVRQDRTIGIFRARFVGPKAVSSGAAGFRLLDRYARNLPGVERLAIVSAPAEVIAYPGGVREELSLRRADAEYWRVLDFTFLEGGPFTDRMSPTAPSLSSSRNQGAVLRRAIGSRPHHRGRWPAVPRHRSCWQRGGYPDGGDRGHLRPAIDREDRCVSARDDRASSGLFATPAFRSSEPGGCVGGDNP
jgi:hypothetical protein